MVAAYRTQSLTVSQMLTRSFWLVRTTARDDSANLSLYQHFFSPVLTVSGVSPPFGERLPADTQVRAKIEANMSTCRIHPRAATLRLCRHVSPVNRLYGRSVQKGESRLA